METPVSTMDPIPLVTKKRMSMEEHAQINTLTINNWLTNNNELEIIE